MRHVRVLYGKHVACREAAGAELLDPELPDGIGHPLGDGHDLPGVDGDSE